MKRLTSRAADGSASVDPDRLDEAVRRLAAYEDMHDDLEARLADIDELIADLSAQGESDAAQANRLIAQKVARKTTVGMFAVYGIE